MSNIPSAVAVRNRPYSSAIAHLTPLVALALIAAQLLAPLAPHGALVQTVVAVLVTLGAFVVVLGWLRHGLRPCGRCIAIRDRTGKAGADTGMVFIRLFHQRKLLVACASISLLLGVALTFWVGLSGHEQYALWLGKIGAVLADTIMALLAYSALCHIAFKPWCTLPHDKPRRTRAADAAE